MFMLACAFAAVAGLATYGCYRCLRAAVRRDHGMPVRDATFQLLTAAVTLAALIREQAIKAEARRPGWVEDVELIVDQVVGGEEDE